MFSPQYLRVYEVIGDGFLDNSAPECSLIIYLESKHDNWGSKVLMEVIREKLISFALVLGSKMHYEV